MLFDLRGRGRRRAVQAIYLTLAILMGGGLVFFGIGGDVQGGLFDAFQSQSGGQSADQAFDDRVAGLEQRVRANPRDAAAYAQLASLRFQLATGGENYDQAAQRYTEKGEAVLRQAKAAWDRHLALAGDKPDAAVANRMVQALGQGGLENYAAAVRAMEIVVEDRDPTSALYAQLAILAHAAGQDRKSRLAADRAVELAPASRRKDVRAQIDLAKTQFDSAQTATQPSS
jgi:hypothetical protein